jgi:hypothetical protein
VILHRSIVRSSKVPAPLLIRSSAPASVHETFPRREQYFIGYKPDDYKTSMIPITWSIAVSSQSSEARYTKVLLILRSS